MRREYYPTTIKELKFNINDSENVKSQEGERIQVQRERLPDQLL